MGYVKDARQRDRMYRWTVDVDIVAAKTSQKKNICELGDVEVLKCSTLYNISAYSQGQSNLTTPDAVCKLTISHHYPHDYDRRTQSHSNGYHCADMRLCLTTG